MTRIRGLAVALLLLIGRNCALYAKAMGAPVDPRLHLLPRRVGGLQTRAGEWR